MNPKIVLAFLGGAVLASGIVYVTLREPAPAPVKAAQPAAKPIYVAPATAAAVPEEVERPMEPAYEPPPDQPVKRAVTPPREKRSPMSSAPKIVTAELRAPAAPPPPPPAPPVQQPINKERPINDAHIAPENLPPTPVVEPVRQPPPVERPMERAAEPPPPPPHTVTITAGTVLPVRIGETLTAAHNQSGDSFLATLDQPLVVDGFVIAERGARLEGRVVEADPGGRVRGTSRLDVELVKLATSDGQHIRIRTAAYQKQAQSSTGTDAAKVGIGAALGAAIGGAAGGGKGAGIGAGVGGAAGAGDVLLTRGKAATIPVESRISFRLQEPVTITERLQ